MSKLVVLLLLALVVLVAGSASVGAGSVDAPTVLPDFTFSWDSQADNYGTGTQFQRVARGLTGTNPAGKNVSQAGVCPITPYVTASPASVYTRTTAGKRFVGDTNGALLHALPNAADVSNCNALRSEWSFQKAYGQTVGDEAYYAFSMKWPASAPYNKQAWDFFGTADTGSFLQHPSYGGSMRFDSGGGALMLEIRSGHFPSPAGSGVSDAKGTPNSNCGDWNPIREGSDFYGSGYCSKALPPRNGIVIQKPLLGVGATKPWTLGVWHDFIVHQVFAAKVPGVLEIYYRPQGGSWSLLFSDTTHPTLQWNQKWGAPGENGTEKSGFYFQLYRAKPHPLEHVYLSGFRRRGSLAAAQAQFLP